MGSELKSTAIAVELKTKIAEISSEISRGGNKVESETFALSLISHKLVFFFAALKVHFSFFSSSFLLHHLRCLFYEFHIFLLCSDDASAAIVLSRHSQVFNFYFSIFHQHENDS